MDNSNAYSSAWKTLPDAAAYLGVTEVRLKQLQIMGKISFFKLGSKYYCTESNLEMYRKSLVVK